MSHEIVAEIRANLSRMGDSDHADRVKQYFKELIETYGLTLHYASEKLPKDKRVLKTKEKQSQNFKPKTPNNTQNQDETRKGIRERLCQLRG